MTGSKKKVAVLPDGKVLYSDQYDPEINKHLNAGDHVKYENNGPEFTVKKKTYDYNDGIFWLDFSQ